MNHRNTAWPISALSWMCLTSLLLIAQSQNANGAGKARRGVAPKPTFSQIQKENRELKKELAQLKLSYQQLNYKTQEIAMSHGIILSLLLSRAAVGLSYTPGKVPTVRQALIKALDVSRTQRLFSLPEPKEAGDAPEYVYYRTVKILSSKQKDGSVKVVFSRLPSNSWMKGRSIANQKLWEVVFTKTGYKTKSYGLETAMNHSTIQQEAVFSKAVSVICSLSTDETRENGAGFSGHITVHGNESENHAFSVVEVSNFPGGTIYEFSKAGDLAAILAGL